jgi:hypothetical protein
MKIFLKAYTIQSVRSVIAQMVFKFYYENISECGIKGTNFHES